jgi:hypothetical protein
VGPGDFRGFPASENNNLAYICNILGHCKDIKAKCNNYETDVNFMTLAPKNSARPRLSYRAATRALVLQAQLWYSKKR